MGGALFRFRLPQRRQDGRRIALHGRGLCGGIGGSGNRSGGGSQFFSRHGGFGFGGGPAQVMGKCFGLADMARQVAIARRLTRLPLQAGDLAFDFADHIFQPRQVGFRGAQAQLGFVAALVQAANAGGFFQDGAARQRLLGNQQADLALAHKGSGAGARRGIGEEYLNIALAHVAAVDAIDAARFALDTARDLDGLEVVKGAAGGAVGVVDEQGDFRDIACRTPGAAGENHIVHFATAHGGGARLAHHPAHGVKQVRLAAAVRADHGGQAGLNKKLRRFDEGLETGKPETCKLQLVSPCVYWPALFLLGELVIQ